MTIENRLFAPKRKGSSSNYLFSGAFAVGFREGKMNLRAPPKGARTQKTCLPRFLQGRFFVFGSYSDGIGKSNNKKTYH